MLNTPPTLTVYVGDTSQFPVEITSIDSEGVETAVNITGHTLSWLVTAAETAGPVLLQKDVTVHSDPAAGLSELELTAANLTTIGGAGEYWLTGVDVNGSAEEITRCKAKLVITDRPQRA